MPTNAEWIASLRKYKGVRFLHQGRSTRGLDCVGLLALAATDIGIPNIVMTGLKDYDRAPFDGLFKEKTGQILTKLPYNRLQPLSTQAIAGDVIIFWIDKIGIPRHVAVYLGQDERCNDIIIHSYAKAPRCVCEMTIDGSFWSKRIDGLWRVPQIEG